MRPSSSRLIILSLCLALTACGDDAGPEEQGSDPPAKDASVRPKDAGKDAAKDARASDDEEEEEDPDQEEAEPTKPVKDAGKPPVDAGAPADAGSTAPKDSGTPAATGDGGASVSGIPEADLDMLRTVCVDEINKYRATLSLTPLTRPDAPHELCSDEGAKSDGVSKQPHGWANAGYKCTALPRAGYNGQNTCPGWPAANASAIASSLKMCLSQMWAEGEPPEGEAKCLSDYFAGKTECFLAHGHYINMKNKMFKSVSCGFYNMGKSTYWMNQDFL